MYMYLVIDNYISAESHPCSPRTRKNILFLFFFVNEYSRLEHTCKLDYFKINFTNLSQTIEDRKHFFLNNRLFSVMYKFTAKSSLGSHENNVLSWILNPHRNFFVWNYWKILFQFPIFWLRVMMFQKYQQQISFPWISVDLTLVYIRRSL